MTPRHDPACHPTPGSVITPPSHVMNPSQPPAPASTASASPPESHGDTSAVPGNKAAPRQPSMLYRAKFWRIGLFAARWLPAEIFQGLAAFCGRLYWSVCRVRREIVVNNLLPALEGDRRRAELAARELFQNFARKLADLWRYESGSPVDDLFTAWKGVEYLESALAEKRGVLFLTPHIGNWEFGAPLLAKRGVQLLVITLPEPEDQFTELRRKSRARWGIETLVIGENPFAIVEIIQRLEAGAAVALLVDRPPAASAVPVQLFGRAFPASIAAAELARASGCVLLPVCLPRTQNGYAAEVLPAISYDRAALRTREARQELTQKIMSAFEPVIRQYLNQWYHFIPIWPI